MVGVKRKISEVEESVEKEAIPSVKDLASSESKLRRQSLQTIFSHLETRSPKSSITSTQALQLWRGFHVALYMHDSKSAISVQNLTVQLASTFSMIRSKDEELEAESSQNGENEASNNKDEKAADADEWSGLDETSEDPEIELQSKVDNSWLSVWSTAFWQTMIREWPNIDQHRINKYLLLVRLVLREIFTICLKAQFGSSSKPTTTTDRGTREQPSTTKKSKSKSKISNKPSLPSQSPSTLSSPSKPTKVLQSQLSLLSLYPLQPTSPKNPNGLRLHVIDIYIDELVTSTKIAFSLSTSTTTTTDTKDEEINETKKQAIHQILKTEIIKPLILMATEGKVKPVRVKAREEVKAWQDEEEGGRVDELVGELGL